MAESRGGVRGRVLLVNPHRTSWNRLAQWLRGAGFGTESVATFEEARRRLTATGPDVLVTEVRLGAFNGLHLAIVGRARRPALVVIVIGPPDAVLAKEADQHDAIYLIEPKTEDALVARVATWFQEIARQRRRLRRQVTESASVECDESAARRFGPPGRAR